MSEAKQHKQVRGITPLLQTTLMQLSTVACRAFVLKDLDTAYEATKTLITISPPSVQDQVIEDLNKLDSEIENALEADGVDLKQRRVNRRAAIMKLFKAYVRPLFAKTFRALYDGQYLEKYARDVDTNIPLSRLLDEG